MKEFEIEVITGYSGFDFYSVIEAETREEAEAQALQEAEDSLRNMIRRLRVSKVEEYDLEEEN